MSSFSFARTRPARRPSLTPMIDVVFLLLVFFMLAARFGQDGAIFLTPPSVAQSPLWEGPPRLVVLQANGVSVNGLPVEVSPGALSRALAPLLPSLEAPIVLRAAPGVPLQRLVDTLTELNEAGLTGAVLVE